MSDEEKLQRVLEYCERVVAIVEAGRNCITEATVAACKSTIAAINHMRLHGFTDGNLEAEILTAWEGVV